MSHQRLVEIYKNQLKWIESRNTFSLQSHTDFTSNGIKFYTTWLDYPPLELYLHMIPNLPISFIKTF